MGMSERRDVNEVFRVAHFPKNKPASRLALWSSEENSLFISISRQREESQEWESITMNLNHAEVAELFVNLLKWLMK